MVSIVRMYSFSFLILNMQKKNPHKTLHPSKRHSCALSLESVFLSGSDTG